MGYISTEQDGAVVVVTIDNPPMNALSAPLLDELEAEIERLDADDAVRAIVLRGAGERAFVAGADIKEFPSLRDAAVGDGGSAGGIQKLGARMDAARTPFIAAIHGFCLGGGLELAMCCDIRVVAEGAQLGQPEIKLGLIPGGGGTQRLPRLVGLGRAQLLNMTGDFIDAGTAYDWGLVEKVVWKPYSPFLMPSTAPAASSNVRAPCGSPLGLGGRRAAEVCAASRSHSSSSSARMSTSAAAMPQIAASRAVSIRGASLP